MRKHLLFIIDSLKAAGAERSLINLLNCIDFDNYEIDLFLLSIKGEFLNQLPKQVNLLTHDYVWKWYSKPLIISILMLLLKGKFKIIIKRISLAINSRKLSKSQKGQQKLWHFYKDAIPLIDKKYDAAIAYMEKIPIYYTVEKINADRKIGWIHIDYKSFGLNPDFDNDYFKKLDIIVTISEKCKLILDEIFPEYKEKIRVIENIVSPSFINKLSKEKIELNNNETILLSIGRLCYQKGFDLAIKACKMLIDDGYVFKWIVLGDGEEKVKLKKMIKELNLNSNFLLAGNTTNPYSFIKKADIYIQPSRFEGKSIAIEEVKILNKPIVVTNFPSVIDQIQNNYNGIIVDIDIFSIYNGIKRLLDNEMLRKELSDNLKQEKFGNEEEINKFYYIITGDKINYEFR